MAKILEKPAEADQKTVGSQQAQALSNHVQQLWQAGGSGASSGWNASGAASDAGGDLQVPALLIDHCERDDQNKCVSPPAPILDSNALSLDYQIAEESGNPNDMQRFKGELSRSFEAAAAKGGDEGAYSLIDQINKQLPDNLRIEMNPANSSPAGMTDFDLDFTRFDAQSVGHTVGPQMQFSISEPTIPHTRTKEPMEQQNRGRKN